MAKKPAMRRGLSARGREVLSKIPVAPAIGYKKEMSMAERVRNMVRSERLREEAANAGRETFDEADDFDIGDDYDPSSPYEDIFDPAAAARASEKPIPKKSKSTDDEDDPPRKAHAVVKDKTFSGKSLKELVNYIRGASDKEVDELVEKEDK